MALQPIGRMSSTLADAAYQKISEAMLAGELPAGTRLVMDALAEELDISRTPVRDALLRLEREGMVEPTGRRGYVVREVSPAEIEQIYQAREAIEGYAARKVAEIGKPAIDHVRRAAEAGSAYDNGDSAVAYAANRKVPRAVVEAIDNPVLLETFDSVWSRAKSLQIFRHYVTHAVTTASLREDHAPLLRAFRRGPDAAYQAMIEHIRSGFHQHGD